MMDWSLAYLRAQTILKKIESYRKYLLVNILEVKSTSGLKTGLNEAFIIDSETRKKLIAEDPNSIHLIKPFLTG